MIYPLTPLLSKLVDFSISLLLLIGVLIYFKVTPTWNMLLLPLFVLYMMLIPGGHRLWCRPLRSGSGTSSLRCHLSYAC